MSLFKDNSWLNSFGGVVGKALLVLEWLGRLVAILPPKRQKKARRRSKKPAQAGKTPDAS